jgi:hypothetical protein
VCLHLERDRLSQVMQRGLVAPVGNRAGYAGLPVRTLARHEARDRADVHDPAASGVDHRGQDQLHQSVAGEQPDLEMSPESLQREGQERRSVQCLRRRVSGTRLAWLRRRARRWRAAGHRQGRVVHQQVDRAELGLHGRHDPLDVVRLRQVGRHRECPAAGLLDLGHHLVHGAGKAAVPLFLGAGDHGDGGALGRELRGDRPPQPSAGSGHNGRPAREPSRCCHRALLTH